MSLNKLKFIKKAGKSVFILVVFTSVLASFLRPTTVKAYNFNTNQLKISYLSTPILNHFTTLHKILKNSIFDKEVKKQSKELNFPKSNPRNPDKIVYSVVTAYTSTVGQTDDTPFISASGKRVYDGMIATNFLPLGTKLKIPELYGDKIFTVDDRMSSRYGHGRMDIWLDTTRSEARKFGVKKVDVEIYYAYDN